ncbi:type I restriction endonuclease subunit R [Campylobacter cuniculorum]|uniref:Type I restriction enzyme endonuclease subunit n=2 Tax=Campylobacter cuniculorum TaxID=374106 RepID=A0A1W6BW79_9BACT|nr:HsdR family type I site-specific deoxyribonuclease [Campylobacter cuniculorum]ARJ56353.1 type I restriction/modification system, R subunit [Campylobacter cuniculorum DSM 23162 = LMG 24588]QOR03841.1 type I restriction endonuclease subunit R [Campylobacter cuniculorum]
MHTETILQNHCIKLFEKLGFKFLSSKEALSLRKNNHNVLLKDILKERLKTLNHNKFASETLERAIKDLDKPLDKGLNETNKSITEYLLYPQSYPVEGKKKKEGLTYIDFEHPCNNDFHISAEFKVACHGSDKTRRPDLVAFVNGIPLAVIELKRWSVGFKDAINQILSEQKNGEIQNLYKFIQITLAGNGIEAKYGTTGTPLKFYNVWEEEDEGIKEGLKTHITDRDISKLDETIAALFSKERFLKLLKHYIFFDKGVKKICRYPQFFATEKTLQRVETMQGDKRNGLIWHTQGSGKSLTMIMLTRLLKLRFGRSKIIVVTDRIDLDKQLSETFRGVAIDIKHAKNGKDLFKKLQSGASVITTLVHKFEKLDSMEPLLEENIFVLIDEAHRTQGGSLHEAMRAVLPNACYIAFTGTPLTKAEKNSFVKFGGEIHRYTINQALKDGAIVPLDYEGRFVEQKIEDKEGMEDAFERMTKNLSLEAKEELKRKWSRFSKIASSEKRLECIVQDISMDFRKKCKRVSFKAGAIFATNSKYEATRYYELFKKNTDLKVSYVISSNEQEELEGGHKKYIAQIWKETTCGNDETYIKKVCDEFKKGDIELLIVVDKLLTGFDAPNALVLYIDKPLKEHNLLQAIARVNRVKEGKECGFIVDYRGLLGELDRTLTQYSSLRDFEPEDIQGAVFSIQDRIKEIQKFYMDLEEFFKEVEHKNDMQSYVNVITGAHKFNEFKNLFWNFAHSFHVALNHAKIYELLDKETIKTYKEKIKFYNELRAATQRQLHISADLKEYEVCMQNLLNQYINANGVNEIQKLTSIFDVEFENEMQKIEDLSARADAMICATNAVIREKQESNPAFYETLTQEILKIIEEYKQKRINAEEKLKRATNIVQKTKQGSLQKSYPASIKGKRLIALYDCLKTHFSALSLKEDLKENLVESVALEIEKIYKEITVIPDWPSSSKANEKMKSGVADIFWNIKRKYQVIIENQDALCQKIWELGVKNR